MVWINLAAAYLGKLPFATQERQDRAIAAFERAMALNPRTPHVHYNLGLIYLERNDPGRAAVHFRCALDTDPTDRDAQHWLDQISRGEETARGATGVTDELAPEPDQGGLVDLAREPLRLLRAGCGSAAGGTQLSSCTPPAPRPPT